jgi:predicted aspartyl protease
MPRLKGKKMGRVSVALDVSNNRDIVAVELGTLQPDKVRHARIQGVVDSGAVHLVLPASVARELGLASRRTIKVRYADGREAIRDTVSNVYVELLGRDAVLPAVVEPRRKDALIGAIVLEALDLLVDCITQRLIPRDPTTMITEIE